MKQAIDRPRNEQSPEHTVHQTPLYILMTPEDNSGNLLTLPGGILPNGKRNGTTGITANAEHIIQCNGVEFTPKARGFIQDDESRAHGYAFLVEAAWHTDIPEFTDYTGDNRLDMIPAAPQPNPKGPLELYHYTSLLARIQSANYRRQQLNERRPDDDKLPLRVAEEAFLRSFGRHILKRTTR